MGAMPLSADGPAAEHNADPSSAMAVSSDIIAKVGAAASDSHLMMPRTTAAPSSSCFTAPVALL